MKLISTSVFSAIITIIRISSGFVAGKVVAMVAGPAGVAVIGQFTNFITIVLTFANGAINNGVVKYTAEYEGDDTAQKKLFSTSLKISLCCSFITSLLLLLGAGVISRWLFNSHIYINPIRVFGITITLYALNLLLLSILNGKQKIKKYTAVNTIGSIISLVFTVILAFFYQLQGALYALVLSQSVVFFVTLVMVLRSDWFSISHFNEKFDREAAHKLFKFSLMAIVTALTVPLSQIVLRNVVISKLGMDSAGYWQGMMRISDGYLMVITTSLSIYYLPKLSALKKESELRGEILQGYKFILPAVFFGCIVIYLLRFVIINLLFTPSFQIMEKLFLYQLIGDFLKMAAWVLSYLMLAKAMIRVFIITEIVFSAGYILLGMLCIDVFGFIGIAIAFAINYFIYFVTMVLIFKKLLFNADKPSTS